MKTTLDLPDDVVRAVKIRSAEENRKLKDTIADLLRRGLAQEPRVPAAVRRRVKLPLVVADVLLGEEVGGRRDVDRGELAYRLLGSGRRFSPERDAVSELLAERDSED